MNVEIKFGTSVSTFIKTAIKYIRERNIGSNDRLLIHIQPKHGNRLLDLFTLGRLLAFIRELKNKHGITSEFFFKPPIRAKKFQIPRYLKNLEEIGFFNFCDDEKNQIPHNYKDFITNLPPKLLTGFDLPDDVYKGNIESGIYRHCLIPLQIYSFEKPTTLTEHDVVNIVTGFIHKFTDLIKKQMTGLEVDSNANLELSRILFVLIKELISNVITHCGESEFLIAMTLSRDVEEDYSQRRSAVSLESGQPKYELLIMDFGQGISRSVNKNLNYQNGNIEQNYQQNEFLTDEYFSLNNWEPRHRLNKAKEKSLLLNIFRGDLVIRKGRKSEGLYELGQTISWFGGLLNFFTGRSELQVSAIDSEELITSIRPISQDYFLPGVIVNAVLPSHQIKTISVKKIKETFGQTNTNYELVRKCEIKRASLPKGFFGGASAIKMRRRSELDAGFFTNKYSREKNIENAKHSQTTLFWDINLKMSENIDVDFIDSFIQELCKNVDYIESSDSKNFYKLIFSNVPRNIIFSLKKRNCASFLMLKETFCLFFDEVDEPHFLGVPRVSNKMFDIEEALMLILYAGAVTVKQLLSPEINMSPTALRYLKKLTAYSDNSIFSFRNIDGQETFVSKDVINAFKKLRNESAKCLSSVSLTPQDVVFKLRNGTYVDRLYDFCLCFNDETVLTDCGKLLLDQSDFPLSDTLIAFMHNGDRLASAIQRFTKTPNLVIVDPHDYDLWKNLEIEGECILIVDALYPGDDTRGYINDFIRESVIKNNDKYTLKQLWVFNDFREGQDQEKASLENVEVVSIPMPEGVSKPLAVKPIKSNTILQGPFFIFPKSFSIDLPYKKEFAFKPYQYSPIELSTEFWQNASALGFIDSERTGRETRNILFYENNEKLIQSPRMRRLVSEFVAEYVKNILDLKIDVIIHPTHPVGSFLAQLVASQLNTNPLVLPLPQKQYGGQIEMTSNEYNHYYELVESHKLKRNHAPLTCLIVDDSVLSGKSLFTMVGIAERLGLKSLGIMVLLNRLTPEISNALSLFKMNFAYLYRLHMPILTEEQNPDEKLNRINENEDFQAFSKSYFSQQWTKKLKNQKSHFRTDLKEINTEIPPTIESDDLVDIQADHMETHALKQIIRYLILHLDPHILNFDIRVAIAYNFLEQLVQEKAFWSLLRALFEHNSSRSSNSQTVQFVRKILYILAFSKHIYPFDIYENYQHTCKNFISSCFQNETWLVHKDLITDCVMWLGIIRSEKLLEVCKITLNSTLDYALDNLYEEGNNPAFEIISAISWALHVYIYQKGFNMIDNESIFDLIKDIAKNDRSGEKNLVLIDILEPLITQSSELREELGIDVWTNEDEFIQKLESDNLQNQMMKYLQDAPGYSCTLKTILRLCKAETVLIYAKNKTDKEYFLRIFDTSQKKRADDSLEAIHFTQSYLPRLIQERMEKSLFFSSNVLEHASELNIFSKGAEHQWCMGGEVNTPDSEMSYYIILGYRNTFPNSEIQNTAYFYWLKCKSLLKKILPQIHSKYVESATEWNAQIQSIRPIHPINSNESFRSAFVNNRRKIISSALMSIDIGEMLRRAVRMFAEPVYSLSDIRNQIEAICKNMRLFLISVLDDERHQEIASKAFLTTKSIPHFVPEVDALSIEQEKTFCTAHIPLMKFIAYECLFNSLSHFNKQIRLTINFEKDKLDSRCLWIIMKIINDVHPNAHDDAVNKNKTLGTSACETAAAAVKGRFKSKPDAQTGLWIATTELPAFIVPEQLREELHGLLK